MLTETLIERFTEKVSPEPNTGCWMWVASLGSHGYGQLAATPHPRGVRLQPLTAHRLSWEIHFGPIPDGLWVLHRCDNHWCVNPQHLFLGTQRDNMRDCARKGRVVNQTGRCA